MKTTFRQGLARYQMDAGQSPHYLNQSVNDNSYIDLLVSADPCVILFAHGPANYLVEEINPIEHAWGPFPQSGATQYLYWDINTATGLLSRGFTSVAPIVSSEAPVDPMTDLHWFDLSTTTMKVWSGTTWAVRIRVFAGSYENESNIIHKAIGSQVGLNVNGFAGKILLDDQLKPLRASDRSFITTESNFQVLGSVNSPASGMRIESLQNFVTASEYIPAYHAVSIVSGGQIALARNTSAIPVHGIVEEDMHLNDVARLVTSGVVYNEQWNFRLGDAGKPLYCGPTGEITMSKPAKSQSIGIILSRNSILVNIQTPSISTGSGGGSSTQYAALFRVGTTEHRHSAKITLEQAIDLIEGRVSTVVLTTSETNGHTHEIEVEYNSEYDFMSVYSISGNETDDHTARVVNHLDPMSNTVPPVEQIAPSILAPMQNEIEVNISGLVIQGSSFAALAPSDTHMNTDLEIYSDMTLNPAQLVHSVYAYEGASISDGGSEGLMTWKAFEPTTGYDSANGYNVDTDVNGNVYLSGTSRDDISNTAVVAKYTPEGVMLWQRKLRDTYNANTCKAVVAPDLSVYMLAYFGTGSDFITSVVKYDAAGAVLWKTNLTASGQGMYSIGWDLSVNSDNEVVIVALVGTVIKLSPSGEIIWQLGMSDPEINVFTSISHDSSNNVYLSGYGRHFSTDQRYFFTTKLTPLGTVAWVKRLDVFETVKHEVTVSATGDVIVVGWYRTVQNGDKIGIVVKYDNTGTLLWQRNLIGLDGYSQCIAAAVDMDGSIYVVGATYDENYNNAGFVVKYNGAGDLQWQRQLGDVYGVSPSAIVIGKTVNYPRLYIAGTANADESSAFIAVMEKDAITPLGTTGLILGSGSIVSQPATLIEGDTSTIQVIERDTILIENLSTSEAGAWNTYIDSTISSPVVVVYDKEHVLIPDGILAPYVDYHARLRYTGVTLGQSGWSPIRSFTTSAGLGA